MGRGQTARQKRISKGTETMIQQQLVNMGDQADAASCVPQALAGRRVGVVRHLNAWDATPSPVACARALGPGWGAGQRHPSNP
jgi:hypothetical protein